MKMKKWLKCLLMTMALMMVVNVGTISTTIPAAAKASAKTIKVGTKFKSGKFQYKVTSLSGNTGTATLIGAKSKKLTSVNVPETVKKGKYTLTVDAIGDNAFKNCKKLKSVATNTKIKKIGKNAFKGCKKLAAVNIKSTELKSVGKNALKGISKKAVVTAPAGTADSYEDLLGVDVEAPAVAAQVFAAESIPVPKPASQPVKAPQTEAPKATETEAAETEAPKAVETEAPKATETEAAETEAAETEAPKAVETEAPKATETEAPVETEAAATEAPKAVETEAPKATETEAPVETEAAATEAPKAVETEAPKATETEAPVKTEAAETEAPKAVETEAPKATETEAPVKTEAAATEAPKAVEAEAPKLTETEAAAEAETVTTEAPKAVETEAPKLTETEAAAPKVKTPAPKPAPKRAQAPAKAQETQTTTEASRTEPATETQPAAEAPEMIETEAPETLTPEEICARDGHLFDTGWVETAQPTCASPGTKRRTCSRCGKAVQTTSFGAPTGMHDYDHVEVAASCEKSGYSYDICKVCGKKTNDVTIPSEGHKWVCEEKAATCTEGGYSYTECSVCHKRNGSSNYTSPKEHQWDIERRIDPTCTESGHVYKICSVCGREKLDTDLPKKAHDLAVLETVAATCTQDGYAVMKCKNCDYTEKVAAAEKAKGHARKYTLVKNATCQQEGLAQWTCTVCGDVLEKVIPKTDHHWTLNEDRRGLGKCAYCEATYQETFGTETPAETETAPQMQSVPRMQSAPAQTMPGIEDGPYIEEPTPETETETETETEHVCEFDWVVTKEPYCGYLKNDMTWRDTGSRTGTCRICGKTVKEGLRAEHHFEVTKDMEPTCTTRGALYSKCTICGYESISFQDENGNIRKALGHDMVHHEESATCTEDGRSYDECSRCGLIENEKVTATKLGHDFTPETEAAEGTRFYSAAKDPLDAYVVREPSCTLVGIREIPCQHDDCGEVKKQYIPVTGHQFETEVIPATCSSNKKIVTTCAHDCGYEKIEIDYGTMLPHQLEVEETKPSTLTERGYVRKVCKAAGCTYTETDMLPLAQKEHTWEHITEGNEGVLASMSYEHRIRTEQCSCCEINIRYAYHLSTTPCEAGGNDYYTNCNNKEHWVGWEDVPCSTKGHTWQKQADGNGHVYCTLCGSIKPESGDSSASRIVWSATFKSDGHCVGFEKNGALLSEITHTTISSGNYIDVDAPMPNEGYVFDRWTWSEGEGVENVDFEIPEGTDVFAKDVSGNAIKSKLHVSCDYMNVTFTAHYKPIDSAATVSEPTETSQVVHGEMDIDLSGVLGGDSSATHEGTVIEDGAILEEGTDMADVETELSTTAPEPESVSVP